MYVGNSDGTLSSVNEGIITVAHLTDLPTASAANAGQFYYITGEQDSVRNVLTVSNGHNWIHINSYTDTSVTGYDFVTVDLTGGAGVDVSSELTLSNGDSKESRFYVKGANGVEVSADTETITVIDGQTSTQVQVPVINISGDTYTLSSAAVAGQQNQVDLKLDSTNTNNDSSVTLSSAGQNSNISISESNGVISFSSRDTRNSALDVDDEVTGFTITVTDSYGGEVSGSFSPTIAYGGSGNATATFSNGIATLNVYTKSEIDQTMQVLNAMHYRGTLGSGGSAGTGINPTTGYPRDTNGDLQVKVGDTFLTKSAFNLTGYGEVPIGSLIIVRGTEDADPTSPTYGYVTSNIDYDIIEETNTPDTTYEFVSSDTGIILQASTGGTPGELSFAAGTGIVLAFSNGDADTANDQEITITHDNVTRTDTTGTAIASTRANNSNSYGGTTTVPVITSITTNAQGHVTGIETTNYNITDTNSRITASTYDTSDSYTAVSGKNVGIIKHTISETFGGGGSNDVDSVEAISSETLKITADNLNAASSTDNSTVAGLNIELVWGSF